MAPRGRTRKAGLQRIDAAFDALQPYGFPKDMIRKTIQNLLKVYGGDEGWVFIEEASYKLVIEAILEQQAQEEDDKNKMMEITHTFAIGVDVDNSMTLEMNEPVVDVGETSLHPEVIAEGPQSGLGKLDLNSGGIDGSANKLPATAGDDSPSKLPVTDGVASPSDLPAMAGDANLSALPVMAGDINQSSVHQSNLAATAGDGEPSSQQWPNEAPRRRRPPCYGWISESEDKA